MKPSPEIRSLIDKWRFEAEHMRVRYGDERAAHLLEAVAVELEAASRMETGRIVGLSEAVAISGYSRDHLRRLIRAGSIPNRGKRGAPLVSVFDLPVKAGACRVPEPRNCRKRGNRAEAVATSNDDE